MRRMNAKRGSAMLEFALTGIPLMCVWISVVQMSIGMWHYATLQYAVKAAGSYVSVHGAGCATPNTCQIHLSDAAQVLSTAAIGIPASSINVTFTALNSPSDTTAQTCRLDQCISNSTYQSMIWPPINYSYPGTSEIEIHADYVFNSAIFMVSPGPGTSPEQANSYNFPAYTHQMMLF